MGLQSCFQTARPDRGQSEYPPVLMPVVMRCDAQVSGTLPHFTANSSLSSLVIQYCPSVAGTLPSFEQAPSLNYLTANKALISGSLPCSLTKNPALVQISCYGNK